MAKDESNASDAPDADPPLGPVFPPADDPDAPERQRSSLPYADTTKTAKPDASARIPKRIGHYHVKRQLASGGMGTVYEATQEKPRRVVAIKLMRQGIASRSAMRRFEYESQILARLRHPGIAQIYEAGTHRIEPSRDREGADIGGAVPFFAMEYIPNALSITKYVKEKKLGTRQKLELFAHVCDAVHHGHQKGIIHRDLKPGNILVDSHGQVKVIDFGVARGTDSDLAVTTVQTDIGQLIGTLQYMSPEQCLADPHDIDTRSDVYALGVVLYELLSGKLPYKVSSTRIFDGTRVIREQQPTKLTTIDKSLKGDVETIVFKALEKDRERRYQSADELRRDIEHYLKGDPISARPPSVVYQLRIFARRNKALVGGVVAVIVALTLGVIGTSIGLIQARDQAARARATLAFLEQSLQAVDPSVTPGQDVTVRFLLDKAARRLEAGELAGQPEAEASIRNTLGKTYLNLSFPADAEKQLRKAEAIRTRVLGDEHPDTLRTRTWLAKALYPQGRWQESEPLLRRTADIQRRVLGEEHPDTLRSTQALSGALWLQGEYAEAEEVLRLTLAAQRRVLGDEHLDTLRSMGRLALTLSNQGKYAEAESLFRQTIERQRLALGAEHAQTLGTVASLGWVLNFQHKSAEAEALLREALPVFRRVLGEAHGSTLLPERALKFALNGQGKFAEAEAMFRELLATRRRTHGDDHIATICARNNLGATLTRLGHYAEAETVLRPALESSRRILGDQRWFRYAASFILTNLLCVQGRYTEAEALQRRSLESCSRIEGDDSALTHYFILRLGEILVWHALSDPDGARPDVVELIALARQTASRPDASKAAIKAYAKLVLFSGPLDLGDSRTALAFARKAVERSKRDDSELLDTLASAYKATGDIDQAVETERRALSLLPPDESSARTMIETRLARFLEEKGDHAGAESVLGEALDRTRRKHGERYAQLVLPMTDLALLLHAEGRYALLGRWDTSEGEGELYEVRQGSIPQGEPGIAHWVVVYAAALVERNECVRAEALLRHLLEIRTLALGEDDWHTSHVMSLLGASLAGQGKFAEAEPLLLDGYNQLKDHAETIPACFREARLREALERIVKLYDARDAAEPGKGYADKAARYRAMRPAPAAPESAEPIGDRHTP